MKMNSSKKKEKRPSTKDKKQILREGSSRWCVGMVELPEDTEDDAEPGYISSDESAHGDDLAERLRAKPSKDIWELDEIQNALSHLPHAEEISPLLVTGHYEEAFAIISQSAEALRTGTLWACWLGKRNLLARLTKLHGFDANAFDDAGRTCLHLSCLVGSEECTILLLEQGANPNKWDSPFDKKATPLHCAASAKNVPCVKVLVANGANVNAGQKREKSALHYAVLSDAPEVVAVLLEAGACPYTPQVFTQTPLHVAASLGSAVCIKLLLDAGADVRAAFGPGKATALHLASEDGHAECARLLLDHGANIDGQNSKGQTPLHLATLAQSVDVVELLVSRKANVKAQDQDGRTPLHGAIVRGARACDVARLLLTSGADPNARDNFGYTPLHIAALNEFSACVLLLLDYGGDVTLRTNGGVSALSFIVRRVPNVLPRYLSKLDDAIHVSEHELGDVDCELTVDFRPLVACLERGEAELLLAFVEVGRRDVLKHPVAETFLFLKWRRIRKFFVLSFIYHALFISLFSFYILELFLCKETTCTKPTYLIPIQYVIILLNLCFLIKEIFQSCLDWWAYIRQWENWLQLLIIIGVFLCAMPDWQEPTKKTSQWQHDVAAVTIFFCWFELMMIIGRFPTFGLYVQMFTTVTVNFAKFLLAYSCILIAFGLAFSVLFSNYNAFTLPAGLVKTVMMMSGELEYEDIFYNGNSTDSNPRYPITAHGMFLIFVLLVTVILTNLLVGLAVSDIQALQESAGLDRLVRQTELVGHLESMLFSSLLSYTPKQLLAVLRWGAVLTATHMRQLYIRPNDPRENRIPKELITSIYKLVASRKSTKRSIRKNNNYEFRINRDKDGSKDKQVKRKSNMFDRYSLESQQVERRRRTTSGSTMGDNLCNTSFTVNDLRTIQEISMVEIKNQLLEITKKLNKLYEMSETNIISQVEMGCNKGDVHPL